MTQPVNDEQRFGDEQLGYPDALFNPEDHGPISVDEMTAYKAFLLGLPQSLCLYVLCRPLKDY